MKKLLALLLVLATSAAMVACNSSEKTTTAATTTSIPSPSITTLPPPTTDPNAPLVEGAETPATGLKISNIFAKGNNLQAAIDYNSIALTNMTPYGESEGVAKLFNGTIQGDKLGGTVNGTVEITWKTSNPTTVNAYVLFTGNDSATYGRLPYSWEFFGSNDNGATWTSIDKVEISGVTKANNAPFGYTVDTPAAYNSYKFAISAVSEDGITPGGTALQLNELVLLGEGATSAVESPIITNATIQSIVASGNLAAHIVDPYATYVSVWGDGAVYNAFDGNTSGTKFGGGGSGAPVNFNWITDVPTTVNNYVLYTASDSLIRGRTPHSWVLYGSTDGVHWEVIDYVADAGIPNTNSTPYGYTVDAPTAYTYYTLSVMTVLNASGQPEAPGALSFNELILVGKAAN